MEFQNKQVPLVSVVMPAWNSGRTIRDAIESVLKQTFTDFELVVCDDFSQDDTQEVLSPILVQVAPVTVLLLRHVENGWRSSTPMTPGTPIA
jgi:glycosyltransferase involved in cell wall biosynthesis